LNQKIRFKLPGHEVKLSFPSMRLGAFEVMYEGNLFIYIYHFPCFCINIVF